MGRHIVEEREIAHGTVCTVTSPELELIHLLQVTACASKAAQRTEIFLSIVHVSVSGGNSFSCKFTRWNKAHVFALQTLQLKGFRTVRMSRSVSHDLWRMSIETRRCSSAHIK